MRNLVLFAALGVAAFSMSGAAVAHQDTDTAAPAKPVKPKKPKKICRENEQSYSRMPVRTCKTAEEWEADADREANRGANQLQAGVSK